jgi:cyclic beta-1,2-glucan glucanotransferase
VRFDSRRSSDINHARTLEEIGRYKVEPYVVAADVCSVSPHVGRGGWTWYTGSAAWMYRAGMEGILGIRREGSSLVIDPCIPATWPGFEATVKLGSTCYDIRVGNPSHRCRGISCAVLNGAPISCAEARVRVPLNAGKHRLQMKI